MARGRVRNRQLAPTFALAIAFLSAVVSSWTITPVVKRRNAPSHSKRRLPRDGLHRRQIVRAYDTSGDGGGAAQLPIASYMVAGLYNCVTKVDGSNVPSRVFLRAGGTLDFLSGESDGEGEGAAEHGYWAILSTDEIELAIPQRGGRPAITWIGRVAGDSVGTEDDDGSELVRISGRIEEGDVDPEFIGSFSMVRTMSAIPREQLLAENARRRVIAARKSALPVYVREQLAGRWRLTADLDGSPLFLLLDFDASSGNFTSVASEGGEEDGPQDGLPAARYLAGRYGVYSPGEQQSADPAREWRRGEGTHFWLWVRRRASRGFALDADLRLIGKLSPSALTPVESELALYSTRKVEGQDSAGPPAEDGGTRETGRAEVTISGHIIHGDIPDMEYSVCVGSFELRRCSDEGELL